MATTGKGSSEAGGAVSGNVARPVTKINIATPAYGSKYSGAYVRSLYRVLATGARRGVSYSFSDIDYADIVVARNYLISNFYFNKKDCSHILFIDDDMGFSEELVYSMLQLDEDVVGVIYPKRQLDLKRLHSLAGVEFEKAYALACDFVGSADAGRRRGDFVEVEACGTGILLVSRKCIDRMVSEMPEIVDPGRFRKLPFAGKFEQFICPFDKVQLPDRELSEDMSFCWRWRNRCKGKIHVNVAHRIQHVAEFAIEAKYLDRF